MDAKLPRSRIARKTDPHAWNSYEHYEQIHESRLAVHPFVDSDKPNTVGFREVDAGGVLLIAMEGQVFCLRNVILEVEKWFETKTTRQGRLQIRGLIYRYVAWIKGGKPILRYHNLHVEEPDVYHHRIFSLDTGEEIFYERLSRVQFPTFNEVLDEIDLLTRSINRG